MEEEGYTLPEYAFTAECDGVESEESGQLDVRGWIKAQLIDKTSGEILKNKKYRIYSADGKIKKDGTTDNDGYIDLEGIDITKYYVFL